MAYESGCLEGEALRAYLGAEVLPHVETPAQYAGGELNCIVKEHTPERVKVALAFPDTYSIGMSYLGFKIFYEILNGRDDCLAERVFAPWTDMEAQMRRRKIPLYSLETFTPLHAFDLVAFSLTYELGFTNLVTMLELGGIPIRAKDRDDGDPLVLAGGHVASNPEPLAAFVDLFVLGEGEEAFEEIVDRVGEMRGRASREEILYALATQVPGVYVPRFYDVYYTDEQTIAAIVPNRDGVPEGIVRRVVYDFENAPYPIRQVVPYVDTVHDRLTLEIMRGCTNNCRFCQAGMITRPQRERSPQKLLELARSAYRETGYEEISLSSLSTADYSRLPELMRLIAEEFTPRGVSINVPSLRVKEFIQVLPKSLNQVRKSGLTLAPETGGDRLRRVINKDIKNEHLYDGVRAAYEAGWDTVKIYTMIGLPTETDEDVIANAEMANECSAIRKRMGMRAAKVNLGMSSFVPKSHTPFQWAPMARREDLLRRQDLVKRHIRGSRVHARFANVDASLIEGVFSRGDRRLAKAIGHAQALGCRFDAWDEQCRFDLWAEAFRRAGIDPEWYNHRERDPGEILPWSHLDAGVSRDYLRKDMARATRERVLDNCATGPCYDCAACDRGPSYFEEFVPVTASAATHR